MSGTSGALLPNEAFALAFSSLPGCGQGRLRSVLAAGGEACIGTVWADLQAGRLLADHPAIGESLGRGATGVVERWMAAAASIDPAEVWRRAQRAEIGVTLADDASFPPALVGDPDPPPILFWRGDLGALARPAVAIVGTRRCTAYGTDVARQLGRDLSAVGVAVVSGLALGIDGAAHEGALAAGSTAGAAAPVAVVGSGVDVVYPRRHRALWQRVAGAGVVLSEAPPGAGPEPWRFPRRNRILAALARVVVVVESHATGGSLSTVKAAIDRGIPVMAVPGSVRSPSSAGTNRLLADGVAPVTGVDDVLTALSLEGVHLRVAGVAHDAPQTTGATAPVELDDEDDHVLLAAVDWTPTATEEVLRRTGLAVTDASARLVRLEVRGLVRRQGAWWERVG